VKIISFGLLELEMANLEHFWRKTPLGPLGVKNERGWRVIDTMAFYHPMHNPFFQHNKIIVKVICDL
jgi:hypothetical protein